MNAPSDTPLQAGSVFAGRYEVEERLGEGGMGVVVRVLDRHTDRPCALKLVRESRMNALTLARFKREFRAASALRHPGCVEVHDFGREQGRWYFTMELVEGGAVSRRRLPRLSAVLRMTLEVLAALDHVHARRIVHRDIKPANILLDTRGARPRAKLSDFGIVTMAEAGGALDVGFVTGSMPYISPEQARGEQVDWRTDLYALGTVVYRLLTGTHPLTLERTPTPRTWITLHTQGTPRPLPSPEFPEDLDALLMRLLARDLAERFATAAEVFDALLPIYQRLDPTPLDLPPLERRAILARPRFVGRAHEVSTIDQFLEDALLHERPDVPVALVLSGEAGVGKSRLATHVVNEAGTLGASVEPATCPAEPGMPYAPLADLLARVDRPSSKPKADSSKRNAAETVDVGPSTGAHDPVMPPTRDEPATATSTSSHDSPPADTSRTKDDAPQTAPSRSNDQPTVASSPVGSPGGPPDPAANPRGRWGRILQNAVGPEDEAGPAGAEERRGERWRFHRRLADGVVALGLARPLVVLVEDVQWADAPTLNLLAAMIRAVVLARRDGVPTRTAFVLTHRPAPDHAALAELTESTQRAGSALLMPLTPLGPEAAGELVASMLMLPHSERVERFTRRILVHEQGNPLYLAQILHALMGQGRLLTRPGESLRWNLEDAPIDQATLPRSIHEAIGDRAARLTADTKVTLAAAAVMGRRFERVAVQAVTERPAALLLDGLDEAVREGFLDEDEGEDAYRFTHDRFREAIYEHLPSSERERLHHAVALDLEHRRGDAIEVAADLAHHFSACAQHAPASEYGRRAADFAMQTYAFAQAAPLYEAALRAAEEAGLDVPADLRDRYGDACLQSGRYDTATTCYDAVLRGESRPLHRAELLRKLAEVEIRRGRTAEAAQRFEQVAREVGVRVPRSSIAVAMRLVANALVFLAYLLLPRLMVRTQTRPDSDQLRVQTRICTRLTEAWWFDDFLRTAFYQFLSINMAERIGPSPELSVALAQQGFLLGQFRMQAPAERYLDRARAIAEQLGTPVERSWEATMRAMTHGCAGAVEPHIEEGRRAARILEGSPEPMRLRQAWFIQAEGLLALGRTDGAERLAHLQRDISEDMADDRGLGWSGYQLGRIAARRGRHARAIEHYREAREQLRRGGDTLTGLMTDARMALSLALLGQIEPALEHACGAVTRQWSLQLRHPTNVAEGVLLVVGAFARRDDALDRSSAAMVRKALGRGRRNAQSMRYAGPLYFAGRAAWAWVNDRREHARQSLDEGIEWAERDGSHGARADLLEVARALLPPSDPWRARHDVEHRPPGDTAHPTSPKAPAPSTR